MNKIEGLNSKINTLATAILGVSFANFVAGALQAADRISDFSDATNISISSLLAFEGALEASGGKAKNMEKIINGLYAAIDTANQGSLAARDAFKAVGVSLDDLKSLDETQILNKTLQGLSAMPAGAERSAIATQLLSRAFRGVDAKAFWEALDSGKMEEYAASVKKAADQQQQLDKAYKNLQLGALQALEPILKMLGEHELSVERAAKVVTILGTTLAVAFGASVLANILKINAAILGTATVSNLLAKNPLYKLFAIGALAAIEGTVAYKAYEEALAGVDKQQKAVADSAKAQTDAQTTAQDPAKIKPAQASGGNANREQGLDARQQAAIESNKRTALAIADSRKEIALRTASDLQKIDIEAEIELQRAKEEIFSKQNLSRAQKEKEYAAVAAAINEKSTTAFVALQRQQAAEIAQQKQQYAQQNIQALGQEYTETQRVTDLIAQQPQKYKEIGETLLANAAAQDKVKKSIEETIRLRQVDKSTAELINQQLVSSYNYSQQEQLLKLQALGVSKQQLTSLEAQIEAARQLYDLNNTITGAYEANMIAQGRMDELTKEQIAAAATYNNLLGLRTAKIEDELNAKLRLAEVDKQLAEDFSTGWLGAYNKYVEGSKNASDQAKTYFDTFTRGFEDSIVKFVQTGKLSFKDLANSIIADFVRIQAKQLVLGLMGGGGGGGGILGGLGKIFGFAGGGNPAIGQPILVGEKGPELMIPRNATTIVPNNQLGGGGNQTVVTYNINATDAQSFQQLLARDPSFLYAVSEKGRRSLPQGAMR